MPALSPPPLVPPVTPITVRRSYRAAPPYAAGGRRTVRLAARPGAPVHAPCAGRVRFAGTVAGSAPALTFDCAGPALRVTVGALAPRLRPGDRAFARATVGHALGGEVGLSVRRPTGTYVDPLPLLDARPRAHPPAVPVAPRGDAHRPRPPAPSAWRPAPVVDGLRTLAHPRAPAAAARPQAEPDGWLGAAGIGLSLGVLVAWAAEAARRRYRTAAGTPSRSSSRPWTSVASRRGRA